MLNAADAPGPRPAPRRAPRPHQAETAAVAYERELEWNEPPTVSERRYARWAVVRAAGAPAAAGGRSRASARSISTWRRPGASATRRSCRSTPVVAAKRGRRGSGDYAGVDGHVQTRRVRRSAATARRAAGAPASVRPPRRRAAQPTGADPRRGRRVAFDNLAALPASVEGPIRVGLPGDDDDEPRRRRWRPVTAPRWPGVVLAECPARARRSVSDRGRRGRGAAVSGVGRSRRGGRGRGRGAGGPTSCSIAMSDGAWGRRAICATCCGRRRAAGGGGRGAAIFCSVGDPSRNHARQDDSAALGADDLASQPWVQAIAACDSAWRLVSRLSWLHCPGGAPANANGPRRRDLQSLRAGRCAGRARASRRAGASTSPPTTPARPRRWRRPPRPASSRRTASSPPPSCARCWR